MNPGEDPTAAFNKIAQTVRRTIALQLQLKGEVDKRRAGLIADRAARQARHAENHSSAVMNVIKVALIEAFYVDRINSAFDPEADPCKPEPHEIERQEMLDDAELLLEDLDEYGDWLKAPVGETVARLCVALGLPSDACVKRGDAWMVRRANTAYETMLEERRGSSPLPPLYGEGQTATPSGWGSVDEIPRRC